MLWLRVEPSNEYVGVSSRVWYTISPRKVAADTAASSLRE